MRKYTPLLVAVLTAISIQSCNIWGGLDTPDDPRDRFLAAEAKADDGDCEGAVDLLKTIPNRTDEQNVALGWAQLCVGGATAKAVASSLYKFSSGDTGSSGSLTVIGELARAIYPTNAAKLASIDGATSTFRLIENVRIRSVEVAISQLVRAAGILALQGVLNNSARLTQSDISTGGCTAVGSDCLAGCVATTNGTISDADITSFTSTINAAQSALGGSGATQLANLSSVLNSRVAGASATVRCFIYKEMIPNP